MSVSFPTKCCLFRKFISCQVLEIFMLFEKRDQNLNTHSEDSVSLDLELGFEQAFQRLRRQFSASSVTRITSQQKHAPNPEPSSHDGV